MKRILIIQTAFIGDVILATGIVEKLAAHFPESSVEFLLRKGNESLLEGHPYIDKIHIWDKKNGKYKTLFKLIKQLRKSRFDKVICLQRFGAMGFLTWRLKADEKIGFEKNPFSFSFDTKHPHDIGNGTHEIERNHSLIASFTDSEAAKPKLYPSAEQVEKIAEFGQDDFLLIAPSSVWFTKEVPEEIWLNLIDSKHQKRIILLGGPGDHQKCERLKTQSQHPNILNLAGQLNLLESAALIGKAERTYSCDSAPMHLASSMNAPVTVVFCSTVPEFGFGPLSDDSVIIEINEKLDCRPCGLHGKKQCPKQHFKCGKRLHLS